MPRVPTPAKITEPRLAQLLCRRGLFRRLDMARRRPVVWLAAPPGSGKSTLIASYLRARRVRRRLWYQVDARDADPATFFHYLRQAALHFCERGRRTLPAYSAAAAADPAVFSHRFFEELFTLLHAPSVLVLDDYQEAPAEAPLHELLRVAVSALPRGCNVIVASRAAPPAAMAGLVGGSELQILGWEDLKLSQRESTALARLRAPGERGVERLHALAGGWAAGLVLLLEHGRSFDIDPILVDGPEAAQQVFDYFAAELFDRCTPATRDLLMRTALTPSFTPAMTERLTGSPQARAMVAQLGRDNFFIDRGDVPHGAWRYHPLFRAFLLDRAEHTMPAEDLRRARRAAGEVLIEEHQPEEAFELLAQAEDVAGCAALIHAHASDLLSEGRGGLLERWIAALPADVVEADGWLLYWRGLWRIGSSPTEATRLLARAAERFGDAGDRLGALLASVDVARATVYEGNDFRALDGWIATVEALLADGVTPPTDALVLQVSSGLSLALFTRSPGRTTDWAARTMELVERSTAVEQRAMSAGLLTLHYGWLGQLDRAAAVLERIRSSGIPALRDPFIRLTVHLAEAVYAWVRGENEAAMRAIDDGFAVVRSSGVLAWNLELPSGCAASLGVAAALSAADPERADATLTRMADDLPRGGRFAQGNYYFYRGWERLVRGDVAGACELARLSIARADECDFPFARALGRIACALALRERGRSDEARALLAEATALVDEHDSDVVRYSYLLTAADCALHDGDEVRGLALLRDGLRLGRERDIANLFWLTPALAARLTERALAARIEVPYVRALIRKWRVRPARPPLHLTDWPWPVEVRTLGRLELRRDGTPLTFRGKAQEMPLRLLCALVALGGGDAAATTLIEALWPDADGDAGRRVLDTTLHRLRRLLGADDAVVMSEARLRLDRQAVWLDVVALEELLQRVERTADPDLIEPLLALYRGPLLADNDYGWVLPLRERLQGRFVAAMLALGRRLEQQGALERAADLYARGLAIDDLAEPFYRALMRCYHRLGRESEALRAYQRCQRVFRSRLGVVPSSETDRLRNEIAARAAPHAGRVRNS